MNGDENELFGDSESWLTGLTDRRGLHTREPIPPVIDQMLPLVEPSHNAVPRQTTELAPDFEQMISQSGIPMHDDKSAAALDKQRQALEQFKRRREQEKQLQFEQDIQKAIEESKRLEDQKSETKSDNSDDVDTNTNVNTNINVSTSNNIDTNNDIDNIEVKGFVDSFKPKKEEPEETTVRYTTTPNIVYETAARRARMARSRETLVEDIDTSQNALYNEPLTQPTEHKSAKTLDTPLDIQRAGIEEEICKGAILIQYLKEQLQLAEEKQAEHYGLLDAITKMSKPKYP